MYSEFEVISDENFLDSMVMLKCITLDNANVIFATFQTWNCCLNPLPPTSSRILGYSEWIWVSNRCRPNKEANVAYLGATLASIVAPYLCSFCKVEFEAEKT